MIYNYGNKNRFFFALIASCVWKETLILRTSNRNSLLKHLFISEKYMAKQFFIFLFCFFYGAVRTLSAQNLEQSIRAYLVGKQAEVGMAVIFNGTDTLTVNNDNRYPLMSVVKFHQALAVADTLTALSESVDHEVLVTPEDLKPNTYSPLRDRYPQGNVTLPLRSLYGGPQATDRYIRSLGLTDFAVQVTEDDMHRDAQTCYDNWSTPLEAVRLMEIFLKKSLFAKPIQDFLKTTLMECKTGTDRLPAPLAGTGARIGHKTGTSDRDASGRWTAINDLGFVLLPDGRYYTIAVFVKHSRESAENTARIIADISRLVYSSFSKKR